jgi:hypothetical protein
MTKEYSKITNCIESSKTQKHFDACDRLINLFEKRFNNENESDTEFMISNLKVKLYKKKLVV